jgi:hypothetical protein
MDLAEAIRVFFPDITERELTHILNLFETGQAYIPNAKPADYSLPIVRLVEPGSPIDLAKQEIYLRLINKCEIENNYAMTATALDLSLPWLVFNYPDGFALMQKPAFSAIGDETFYDIRGNWLLRTEYIQVYMTEYPKEATLSWFDYQGKSHIRNNVHVMRHCYGQPDFALNFSARTFIQMVRMLHAQPASEFIVNPFTLDHDDLHTAMGVLLMSLDKPFKQNVHGLARKYSGQPTYFKPNHAFAAYAQLGLDEGFQFSYVLPDEANGLQEISSQEFIERMLALEL